MTRKSLKRIAVVLVLVYLVASAQPVAAASVSLVVGSQHTDCTDFNNAQTLDSVSVTGSGDACSVEFTSVEPRFSDGFDDEPAGAGVPAAWTTVDAPTTQNVTTKRAYTGSQSYYQQINSGFSTIKPSEQPYAPITNNVSLAIWHDISQGSDGARLQLAENGTITVQVGMRDTNSDGDSELVYSDGTNFVTISTVPDANEWVHVTIYNIDPASDTFAVKWSTPGDTGTATGLTMRNAMTTGYTDTLVGVVATAGFFDNVNIAGEGGTATKGKYISANHSVSNASQARINITTATNVTVYGTVQEYTSGTWSDVASTSWTTTGNKSLDISAASSSTLRVNVTFEKTGSDFKGAFGDESILFTDHPPQVDNSSASPQGGAKLTSQGATLSINVSDREFGTAQGDTLTAEFYLDGSLVDTQTVNSNTTVSYTASGLMGGSHEWHVEVTDAYGLTTTSDTFTFKVPATLYVRNEQNATQLVDENVNVTVQFITEGGEVVTRTTSDGTISLNGLPVADRFVVSADAENWTARRTVITNIYEQNSIYLLRDTASTVTVTFDLQDDTGNFPASETTLYIQTALDPDGDGNSEYVTVSADTFGATGTYSATLVQDERYRLMVTNQDGDTRVLGSYIPRASGTEPLPIGQISLQGDVVNGTAFGAALRNVSGERVIRIQYRDPSLTTTELYVYVYQAGNESNVLRENTSVAGPFGTYTETVVIPDGAPTNRTYVVEYTAVRDGSPNVHGSERVGAVSEWSGLGIDPQLLEIIAMTGIVAFAGLGVIIDGSLGATAATVMAFLVTVVGAVYIHPLLLMLAAVEALLFLVGRQY